MTMSDDFDWSAYEEQMSDIVDVDVDNVTELGNEELLTRFHKATEDLRALGQMLRPTTSEGRDLHSMRAALRVELAKRKMM